MANSFTNKYKAVHTCYQMVVQTTIKAKKNKNDWLYVSSSLHDIPLPHHQLLLRLLIQREEVLGPSDHDQGQSGSSAIW